MEEDNKKVDWLAARERLKNEYPQLTEEDLKFEDGREEEWLEHLQAKMNKTKHEIRGWLRMMG